MKKAGIILGVLSLCVMGYYVTGNIQIPGKGESDPIGPYFIVQEVDGYGVPIRCAQYTRPIHLSAGMPYLEYRPADGVRVTKNGFTTIVTLELLTPEAEELAYEILGLDEETCARVQERRFDPGSDTYVGPADEEAGYYGARGPRTKMDGPDGGTNEPDVDVYTAPGK